MKIGIRALTALAGVVVLVALSSEGIARQGDSRGAADELNKKADEQYRSGKFREAIASYQEVLKLDANNDHAFGYIGYSFNKLGESAAAREWMKRRIELPGQTPSRKAQTLTEMSLLYWDQAHLLLVGQMATARALVGQTSADDLLKTEGGVTAAKLLIEGIDSAQKAVAIAPRSAKAFNLLNLMYRATAALESDAARKAELIAKGDEALRQSVQFFTALKDRAASDLFLTPTISTINGTQMGQAVKVGAPRKKAAPEGLKDESVAVEVIVGIDGKVRLSRIIGGQSKPAEAALSAVRQWEFEPTTFEGSAVQMIHLITLPSK
jgi:tetratricopeptide (TPR) repeat protein